MTASNRKRDCLLKEAEGPITKALIVTENEVVLWRQVEKRLVSTQDPNKLGTPNSSQPQSTSFCQ